MSLRSSSTCWATCFKLHQRGGGCCSVCGGCQDETQYRFKPHQRGGGCCSIALDDLRRGDHEVSNPISGEVGAAAEKIEIAAALFAKFQTPSAGRWVLQHGDLCACIAKTTGSFKPHQRGGGCCSSSRSSWVIPRTSGRFKPHQRGGGCCSPLRGRAGAATLSSFKPHQRGGGCCSIYGYHPDQLTPF